MQVKSHWIHGIQLYEPIYKSRITKSDKIAFILKYLVKITIWANYIISNTTPFCHVSFYSWICLIIIPASVYFDRLIMSMQNVIYKIFPTITIFLFPIVRPHKTKILRCCNLKCTWKVCLIKYLFHHFVST